MRIRFAEEEQFPNASYLWEANQERSLKGRKGQAALRRLEAALLALPAKRLVADTLEDGEGQVCALAALAKHEHYEGSLQLPEEKWDDGEGDGQIEAAMLALAEELKVPKLVAIAIIARNDEGYLRDPRTRYNHILQWVQRCLRGDVGWIT
jgi:hypothetical protein